MAFVPSSASLMCHCRYCTKVQKGRCYKAAFLSGMNGGIEALCGHVCIIIVLSLTNMPENIERLCLYCFHCL